MKTAVSCSVSSIKNMSILYEFAVKIKSMISVQFQSMMITAVSFRTNQTDTAMQIVKNLTQLDFSSTRQDRNRLKKSD